VPRIPSDLAERILTEDDTKRLLAGAELVEGSCCTLLYLAGLRASELCGLRWGAVVEVRAAPSCRSWGRARSADGAHPDGLFGDLMAMRPDDAPRSARFTSISGDRHRWGRAICSGSSSGPRPPLACPIRSSSHWLRHCHASHAIDAGAAITLVRDTLGHST
jgi:integrase/recombinase XerD